MSSGPSDAEGNARPGQEAGAGLPGSPADHRETGPDPGPSVGGQLAQVSWSGPLPPPRMLDEYEAVLPGTAERLLAMVEREQAFRHRQHESAARYRTWGLFLGWSLGAALVGGAIAAGMRGDWKVAAALAAGPGVGMLWKLVQGSDPRRRDDV